MFYTDIQAEYIVFVFNTPVPDINCSFYVKIFKYTYNFFRIFDLKMSPENRKRRAIRKKLSPYECENCDAGLCIVSCFNLCHTQLYY